MKRFSLKRLSLISALAVWVVSVAATSFAADNQLSPKEKAAGWQLLFNGRDYTGWKCNNGRKVASPIEQHALMPHKCGGHCILYKEPFSDFILKCDVQMSLKCNSGIFIRMGNRKNFVQTSIEMQVFTGKGTGYHDFGALYDLVKPTKNTTRGPGEWNHVVITCKGPHITVAVNGETVTRMNCNEFTTPRQRLDGTRNKFRKAIKDFPRKGYLGFQDHGDKVWFKNVKLLDLIKHP